MSRRGLCALLSAVLVLAAGMASAAAYPRPGHTDRVSVTSEGAQGNGWSIVTSMSADGRYVGFHGEASNLVPGDTNGVSDVFVLDRQNGVTERVSVGSDGTQSNGAASRASLSGDGRFVAFQSVATNLVTGDTNGRQDVFVRDRDTGITERVSVASDGTQANAAVHSPSLSADGRYVAFESVAPSLAPGGTTACQLGVPCSNVFLHDRETGTTELISVTSGGSGANGSSYLASVSADGRHVAFRSAASNLVPGDTNGGEDIFVRDRDTGTTGRVSVASGGTQGNRGSWYGAISADGRHVAFESLASNLVPWDTNGVSDVFVHDRQTGVTERVSVASDGAEADAHSYFAAISADGRYVAFYGRASNLVPGDTNGAEDAFVHDRATGVTERISVGNEGAQATADSSAGAVSADGRFVAFTSPAANLVPGDANGTFDAFVRDRGPSVGVGRLSAVLDGDRVSVAGWATFSGHVVASASDPEGDGVGPAGADLTGAAIVYRPEQEDLLVRLRLESLPRLAVGTCGVAPVCVEASGAGAGAPGVIWGLRFTVEDASYEIRVLRAAATSTPADAPYFALYGCDLICAEQTRLGGGIGTTGKEIRVAVPLSVLDAEEGMAVTGIQAFVAFGEAAPGAVVTLDELALPDGSLSAPDVTLGVARAGTPKHEVAFDTEATLAQGEFAGSIDGSALPPGDYEVWAQACLADACEATSRPVSLGETL